MNNIIFFICSCIMQHAYFSIRKAPRKADLLKKWGVTGWFPDTPISTSLYGQMLLTLVSLLFKRILGVVKNTDFINTSYLNSILD